jgi:thiamine pyrophosphate-dependent acetolactate synthase large subunit-like protein
MLGMQSLWSSVKYDLPITVVVFNNSSYMAIKSSLHRYDGKAAGRELIGLGSDLGLPDIDFAGIARSFGGVGERVESPGQLRPALRRALDSGKLAVVDVIVDPRETGYGRPPLP